MMKKFLKRSLTCGAVFIILSGSLLVAADKKTIIQGQRTQKIDPSYKKYNELAQQFHDIQTPTDDTIQEFKAILQKNKQLYDKRKECKKELDLLLIDMEAKVAAYKIAPPAETTDRLKNIATIAAAQKAGMPTFLSPKGQELMQKATTPKTTSSEPKLSQPQAPKSEAPKTTPANTKLEAQVSLANEPTETIIQKPDIDLTLPPVKITTEKDTFTTSPARRKELELEAAAKQLVPVTEQQKIISFAVPNFMTQIVQPFENFAIQQSELKGPEQGAKAGAALLTVQNIIPLLKPTEQQTVADSVAETVALVEKPNGKKQIIDKTEQLINELQNRLPSANLHKNFEKINVEFGTAQSDISISRGGMSNAVKQIAQSSLTLENTIPVIDTLQNAIAYDNYALMRAAPELSTALVMADSPVLTQKTTELVIPMLDRYTTLKTSFATRVQELVQDFNNVPKVGIGWFELFAKPDVKQQVGIIEQLLALYIGLQKVGREVVYGIEQTFNTMGYIMDSATIEQWESQNQLVVAQEPSILRTELEKSITSLRDEVIKKLIEKIQEPTKKNQLLYQLKVNTIAATEYYAQTQERLDTQYWDNVKAFTSAPVKKEPVKQRITLPGIKAETTKIRKPKPKLKPIEPTPLESEPVTEEEFVPLIEGLTQEEQQALIPVPQKTALDVLTPSAQQQINAIKKQMNTLDILKNNTVDVIKLQTALNVIKDIDQKEQNKLAHELLTKKLQIERVAQMRTIINEINQKDAQRFKQAYRFFKETLTVESIQPFPQNAYEELKKQFEAAATNYATQLTNALTPLINLHQNIANDISQLEQLPDNLLETISTLSELTDFLDKDPKATLQNVFIGLCALYDAILSTLFISEKISKIMSAAATETENTDAINVYKDLITYVKDELASRQYEEVVTNAFFPLLNQDTREKVRTSMYDLTKTNTVGLTDEIGTYIYALPEKTEVVIDENTKIPTLTEIGPKHNKQYTALLEQWYERINNNDTIQKLIDFKNSPTKAYTPEELEEIKNAIKSLQELLQEGTLPEAFFNDLRNATTESEAFKNAQANIDIKKKITELKQVILDTNQKFKTTKTIEEIYFKSKYNSIKNDIETYPVEDQRASLLNELNTVLTPYNTYLTDVALSYTKNLTDLPAHGFNNEPKLSNAINTIETTFNKISSFTNMITEIQDLKLLNTTTFETLYKELLKGYGYILATFDALNAKMVDTAHVKTGFLSAFFSNESATYKTAQTLIQLLSLISKLRSTYANKLLDYFEQTPEMNRYANGTLNVIDLGVENMGTKDAYLYARTQIEGYTGKPDVIFPTGNHKQDYSAVIRKWQAFIESSLKATAIAEQQKEVSTILTQLLETKVLNTPFKNIHDNQNNFFDTLTQLMNTKNTNTIKQADSQLKAINRQITQELVKNIKQLKTDRILTDTIQTQINLVCGNSIALLEGLIYWIYNQTNDANTGYTENIIEVAKFIQEPISNLAKQASELVPYVSTEFQSLEPYAFKEVYRGPVKIPQYRYLITQKGTALIDQPGPVMYKEISLKQTGKTTTKKGIEQQITTLDSLIKALQSSVYVDRFTARVDTLIKDINDLSQATDTNRIDQLADQIQQGFQKLAQENNLSQEQTQPVLQEIARALINAYQGAE